MTFAARASSQLSNVPPADDHALIRDGIRALLEEIVALAVQRVLDGETFVSVRTKDRAKSPARLKAPKPSPTRGLTARQSQVLCLLADGHTTKSIALNLDISAKTVETHRAQLMERLNIFDTAGLVRYAIRVGLITA